MNKELYKFLSSTNSSNILQNIYQSSSYVLV